MLRFEKKLELKKSYESFSRVNTICACERREAYDGVKENSSNYFLGLANTVIFVL